MKDEAPNTARFWAWDYAVLAARLLLASTFLSYGYAKLSGNQFGISAQQMELSIRELGLFKLAWYLFDQEPFKSFIGISQISAALLLLWHRTVLLGALLLVPITINILVIDITYLKFPGLYWRLSHYLLLLGMIFWHYRNRIWIVWHTLTSGLAPRVRYRWWAYALLPLAALGMDLLRSLAQLLLQLFINPVGTWQGLLQLLQHVFR